MHGSTLTQGRPLEQAMLTASHESAVPRHARSRVSGGACAPGCTPGGISQLMAAVDSDDSVCGRAHAKRVLKWSSVSTCARAPGSRRARPVAAVTALSLLSAAVTALSCLLLLSLCCHTQRAQKRAGSTSSRGSVAKWRSNRPCVHTAECSSAGRTTSPAQGPEPAGPDSGPRAKSRHRAPCPSAPLL